MNLKDLIGSRTAAVHGPSEAISSAIDRSIRLAASAYIDLGNLGASFPCLSDPSKCETGFTLAMWVRLYYTRESHNAIVGNGGLSKNLLGLDLVMNYIGKERIATVQITGSQEKCTKTFGFYYQNLWMHYAVVWTKSKKVKIYIDTAGSTGTCEKKAIDFPKGDNYRLGPVSKDLTIDDMVMWNEDLTSTRFKKIMEHEEGK